MGWLFLSEIYDMRNIFVFIGLCLLLGSQASAEEVESPQSIREAVQHFLDANVDSSLGETVIKVLPPDRRLRLGRCEKPLEPSFPVATRAMGSVTVSVRCPGAKPWTVMVRATIQQFVDVVVAGHSLARNHVVGLDDIKMVKSDISHLAGGYFTSQDKVVGMVVKRPLRGGMVIGETMLMPPIVVKRGEKVVILAETGSILVRMSGVAVESGAVGKVIKVENLSSRQLIEAVVVSPGVVKVRM